MTIKELRQQIDRLDRRLLPLLNRRIECAAQIGALKRARGRPVFVPEREEKLLRALQKENGGPLRAAELKKIYRVIFEVSKARQRDAK